MQKIFIIFNAIFLFFVEIVTHLRSLKLSYKGDIGVHSLDFFLKETFFRFSVYNLLHQNLSSNNIDVSLIVDAFFKEIIEAFYYDLIYESY